MSSLFRTKTIEQSLAAAESPSQAAACAMPRRSCGWASSSVPALHRHHAGRPRPRFAGPAVTISFVIAGLACALAALCYAEFASTVPVAGSAYTFSYATFGELIAWIIGWDLILELMLGASVDKAQGWWVLSRVHLVPLRIAVGSYGNAGRNTIPGPGTFSLNVAFARSFNLAERRRLEFRLETTNLLNHVNYTNYYTVVNAVNYGLPSAAAGMRTMQAVVRIRF